MMTLELDARIQAAMQRQAEREAAKQAEEEAAKQAAWRDLCQKSEAYYAPLWEGDLTPDLRSVLGIEWMDSGRNSVPLRFSANLDGHCFAIEWQPSASFQRAEDDLPRGQWRVPALSGGPMGRVERGELADTLLAILGRIRQERAEKEAREAEAERLEQKRLCEEETYRAERRRLQAEREARAKAEQRACWQALEAEHATARPLVDAYVAANRFHWPDGVTLTLYRASWCEGFTYDDDEGAAPTYTHAWGLSDRPDADGYYLFEGEGKSIKPPRETLVWERYAVDGLDSLPPALRETFTVSVPGFTVERMYHPDTNRQAEFIVRREGYVLERPAGSRPVRWVRAALGLPDPPPAPAESRAAEDDCPF